MQPTFKKKIQFVKNVSQIPVKGKAYLSLYLVNFTKVTLNFEFPVGQYHEVPGHRIGNIVCPNWNIQYSAG